LQELYFYNLSGDELQELYFLTYLAICGRNYIIFNFLWLCNSRYLAKIFLYIDHHHMECLHYIVQHSVIISLYFNIRQNIMTYFYSHLYNVLQHHLLCMSQFPNYLRNDTDVNTSAWAWTPNPSFNFMQRSCWWPIVFPVFISNINFREYCNIRPYSYDVKWPFTTHVQCRLLLKKSFYAVAREFELILLE
jgi:hypothetical protein